MLMTTQDYPSFLLEDIFLSKLSKDNIYKEVIKKIKRGQRMSIFPLNMHSLRLAHDHASVQRVFRKADIIFPDGVPILWIAKKRGLAPLGRVSGTDLVERILKTPNIRVFLLGSTKATLTTICQIAWVQAKIVGAESPTFKQTFAMRRNPQLAKRIRRAKPQIILAALGQPKQEFFLSTYLPHLPPCIGFGVGSALDILSGQMPRAPKALQPLGLEWAWRLVQDPLHLFKRYVLDARLLITLFVKTNK
jgi:exopolysaccharide biosynthesis WecB/TagA/CpsF family protein